MTEQPLDDKAGVVWIKSDLSPDGVYIASVEVGMDLSIPLDPQQAVQQAMCILSAVTYAEYDAAVMAQFSKKLGMAPHLIAGVIRDLREERPPIPWKHPLTLEPGVNPQGKPFLHVKIGDDAVGQWEMDDARSHAVGLLEVTITCDLDNAYFRYLRAQIELEPGKARNVVNDLEQWRYTR